ncbi:MAG: hypothetical protein AB202_03900 [Parcubacteria bacterium C7867-007]|nr:MAG: hypothetical protein AB202_03900 [Parcubacteria bacterium C7867-007]
MIGIPSLLRLAEHSALRTVALSGKVLDLGGDANSEYLSFIKGSFSVTRLNLDPKTKPDILHNLEEPLPVPDAAYDGVVLFNVLEHIYAYRALVAESVRVLSPGGTVLVVVPFLFPVHPSPDDFHRFTASTLRRELQDAGLSEINITPLGGGVWSAQYLLIDRLLPKLIRFCMFYTCRYLVQVLDTVTIHLAHLLGKKYDPADYALGFLVTGRKI